MNHHGYARHVVAPLTIKVNQTRINNNKTSNNSNSNNIKEAFPDAEGLSKRASQQKRVAVARMMATKGLPTVFGLFVFVYFVTGAMYYRS